MAVEQDATAVEKGEAARLALTEGRRVAAVATALTLLLVILKGTFGYLRHSPALVADAVHSGADALAIFASWVGLKLASRPPTKRFPFGLYRAETLACLLVAVVIAIAGVGLLVTSVSDLTRRQGVHHRSIGVLFVALASAVVSFGIFVWEKRVGTRLNSQSLLANADESRADIMTSLVVFVGTAATYLGAPAVELGVSGLLSLLIIWLGFKHGRVAMYALLDASLNRDLELRATEIARRVPGVMDVDQVKLRQAGPFCFGIAQVHLRKSTDVARAHEVAHEVIRAVTDKIPQVESLTVHVEPYRPETQTVMVPLSGDSMDARVSEHFGRAEFFLFATVSSEGVADVEYTTNTASEMRARAALAVIRGALKGREVDAVLTREIGEIAFHTLRDHHVDIYSAPDGTVRDALDRFLRQDLTRLVKPTHPSEAAGAPPSSASDESEQTRSREAQNQRGQ